VRESLGARNVVEYPDGGSDKEGDIIRTLHPYSVHTLGGKQPSPRLTELTVGEAIRFGGLHILANRIIPPAGISQEDGQESRRQIQGGGECAFKMSWSNHRSQDVKPGHLRPSAGRRGRVQGSSLADPIPVTQPRRGVSGAIEASI
jgi:hypothetical protein